MGLILEKIVPWGRSYEEYIAMFNLTDTELKLGILGCGDGPAGFNAELTRRGGRIVSVDPIYAFDVAQIKSRILTTYATIMAQMRKNQADYVWEAIASVEDLGRVRMSAMNAFLSDYKSGKKDGRYIAAELPSLPLENGRFDIALSSHFLFLYSDHLSPEFHLQALKEMLRIACQVRVFPLLTLAGTRSPHLESIMQSLESQGFGAEIRRVPYEFQRGGNEMLLIEPV
ncbi:class I SAM-dependent methyltransferase [Methylobacter sp. YRD-M1]|uniref:class I SAM-dependent methyltransferase n=1 Tax=Methylobacter sp. YRD-M1 TaxID=2911520 RepID=UPI00227A7EDA|nr:class I SAM-dependent methyltransferase [Methylobacter sp. YRD-M1]WAK02496.1 class I SAM-dependent methyltransferase [Methylobacter sp. YRD-M1]